MFLQQKQLIVGINLFNIGTTEQIELNWKSSKNVQEILEEKIWLNKMSLFSFAYKKIKPTTKKSFFWDIKKYDSIHQVQLNHCTLAYYLHIYNLIYKVMTTKTNRCEERSCHSQECRQINTYVYFYKQIVRKKDLNWKV